MENVGAPNVKEPGLLHIMDKTLVIVFVKTIEIMNRGGEIQAAPGPIQPGISFPFQVTFVAAENRASASQLALGGAGEISELERIAKSARSRFWS